MDGHDRFSQNEKKEALERIQAWYNFSITGSIWDYLYYKRYMDK